MAGETKKSYRVWVSGRKETTTEIIKAASSLYARIAKAGRHGVKSTDCVAQRVGDFNKAIAALKKAERAAQKAQLARDAAETRWNEAMEVLRPDGEGYMPEWLEYCEQTGAARNYNFGDIVC